MKKRKKRTKSYSKNKNKFLENNKTTLALVIAGFFVLALFVMFINNQQHINITGHQTDEFSENIEEVGTTFWTNVEKVFKFLLNIEEDKDTSAKGITQLLLAHIFALIIVFGIFWIGTRNMEFFDDYRGITNVIVTVVSILVVRGINEFGVIEGIFFPYGVLGVTLVSALPFMGAFLLINVGLKDSKFKFLRKFLWILFAVSFVTFWIMRYKELGTLSWIYAVTAGLAVVMAFIDGTISGIFIKMEAERLDELNKSEIIMNLKKRIDDVEDAINDYHISQAEGDRIIARYNKRIKSFMKKGSRRGVGGF